jgi:Ca-activated chloride channel family protein
MKDLMAIEFLYPWVLLGLLALPVLAWMHRRPRSVPSLAVPSLLGRAHLGAIPARQHSKAQALWSLLPLALLLVGLARPRMPRGDLPDPSKGIDIMLALDFSRSMAETDFRLERKRVSRRAALEYVTERFILGRPNDRIGIVCFARNPFLVSPLTLDHRWAIESMRQTDLATGTGIGWAVMAAGNFLRKDSDRSKVVILVTDGDNSSGPRASEIIGQLVRDKVKLYSVLIGPEMVTPSVAANHDLNRAARITGGQFFQANDTRALQGIYNLIDQLEKRELIQKRFVLWQELFLWPVAAGSALWLGGWIWTRLLRRPLP